MAYIGNTPAEAYTSIDKQDITGNGGASYTLDHPVANENEIEVFVNNVRQEPSVAYTVSGTALTMTGNVEASDDFYVVFQGKAIQTTSHPEGQDLKARDVTATGTVTADGLTLGDNQKAQFGAGNDLEIYHDGSHSVIKESGTGNLRVFAENYQLYSNADNSTMMRGLSGGAVELYHNGSKKLASTANGIETFNGTDVSMSSTGDGQLRIDGNGYTGAIALDATGMHVYNNSSSRALVFGTNETERMRITGGGNVGIGTVPNSNSKLHVLDTSSSLNDYTVHIEAYTPAVVWQDISTSATDYSINVDGNAMQFRYGDASTETKLASEAMRINSSGSVNFNEGTTGTWKYLRENVSFPTNATYVDVTGIPSAAEEIQIIIYECDMATNDQKLQLRIGDSGGLETSGYFGGAQAIGESWRNESSTRWFLVDDNVDTKFSGIIDLASMNGSNRWVMRSIITDPDSSGPTNDIAAGSKLVSGSLDRIRLYTESGNFTDGEYSVRYR